MIVIDELPEAKFLDRATRLRGVGEGYRCLTISPMSDDLALRTDLLTLLHKVIPDKDQQVYLCRDGDILVVAQGMHFQHLREVRSSALGPQIKAIDQLEFVHGWSKILKIAQDKYDAVQAIDNILRADDEALRKIKRRQAIIDTPIEPEMIASIRERRARHTRPDILVVEDDAFSAKLVANTLRDSCHVTTVGDGPNALLFYAVRAPHVVFLDINLPEITGHDLLLRMMQMDPDAYIIMLSGNAQKENVMKSLQEGAKGFIAKPFTKDKLFTYIKRCPTFTPEKGTERSPV